MNLQSVTLQIAADHPALPGHFPGAPIVPGVVLLDETLHAIEQSQPAAARVRPWQIGTVKFHRVARPGETLQLHFYLHADGSVHFELRSAGSLVASGTAVQRARMRAVASAR